MKKALKRFYLATAITLTLLFGVVMYTGCQTYLNEQGQQVTRLTDETVEVLDKAVELAPTVTEALVGVSIAFPALAAFLTVAAGIITGFAGAYKKYRPQLTKERAKAQVYADTVTAIVYAIQAFKEENREDWDILKLELKTQLMDKVGPEALAIIEAIVQAYQLHEPPVQEV